jgi:hypothetical protein
MRRSGRAARGQTRVLCWLRRDVTVRNACVTARPDYRTHLGGRRGGEREEGEERGASLFSELPEGGWFFLALYHGLCPFESLDLDAAGCMCCACATILYAHHSSIL